MLKRARVFRANQQVEERVMDSMTSNESLMELHHFVKEYCNLDTGSDTGEMVKINIVDTPTMRILEEKSNGL